MEPARARVSPAGPGARSGVRHPTLVLAIILAAGLLLRLAPASWMSYFGDEVYSLDNARHGLGAALVGAARDLHPPLFNGLLSFWLRIAPSPFEWEVRLLPMAIGLLWVLATYRLATLSLSPRASLVAAAVIGLHPMAVLFTEPVRWYGLLALAITMALVHLERGLRRGRGADFAWLAFWNVVAGWTSVLGWIFALATLLLWPLRRRWSLEPTPLRAAAVSYTVSFAALLPVMIALVPQIVRFGGQADRTGLRAGLLVKPAYLAFALVAGQTSYPWDPPTLAAVALCLTGLSATLWQRRRHLEFTAALAVWLPVVVTSLLVVTNLSAPHYYLVLVGGVALLAGWLTEQPGRAPRVALLGFAAAGALGLVHLERGRQFQREEFLDPWRAVVAGARARTAPGDVVLFSHPSVGFYAAGDARFRVISAARDLPGALSNSRVPGTRAAPHILAVISPLSGMLEDLVLLEHWLADSLAARGYTQIADSGLVRSDAPEARRRFSGRPFPAWRVRLLEWRNDRDTAGDGR